MISVIIPVYKVEAFLPRCIDSIINQTYKDLEIILVDDGSPDKCSSICDEYARCDTRIKVIHQTNQGIAAARNAGLNMASGEYIAFVDSDDWLDPDSFQVLHQIACDTDADIVEGSYRHYRPWMPSSPIQEGPNTLSITTYTGPEALERLYTCTEAISDIAIMVWDKLYRADILKNLRFLEGYVHEDIGFTPLAIYAAKKLVKYDRSFYFYNIRNNSITHSDRSIHKIDSLLQNKKRVRDFFSDHYVSHITETTASAYLYALSDTFYQCHLQRKDPAYRQKKKEIYAQILASRPDFQKLPNRSARRIFNLLAFAPGIYCLIKSFAIRKEAARSA